MSPTVSVVLPTFNRKDSIRASINSVLTQSFADLELIVVDDGSKEDIKSVLDIIADPRLKYIRRERNGGAAAARNTGIAAATGRFIAFQDSDDLWLPRKLEWQLDLFAGLPVDFGIVTSSRILYGRDENFVFGADKVCVVPALRERPRGMDQVGAMLHDNRLSLPCALFRRDVLPTAGWFDTCAAANEDWEFAVRISQRTRIHEDHRPVMLSFISADSISGSRRKQSLGTLRILRANGEILRKYPRQRAAIMLDVSRSLAATGKGRWARRFLLESLSIHPSAIGLLAQSILRRTGRSVRRIVSAPRASHAARDGGKHESLVARAALFAQRHSRIAPPAVRRLARLLVGRAVPSAPAITGWTTQLVGSEPLGEPPEARPGFPLRNGPLPAGNRGLSRPRCLIVAGVLDVGGTDEVAAFLARRLPEHGIATMVAHSGTKVRGDITMGGRLPRLLKQEGIRVEDVSEADADRLLLELRPDVISAHCPPLWWLDAATRAGVPFVETLHGMHDLYDTDWAEEARRARSKARLIAVSALVRQQYLQGNPGYDPSRIVIVPNSVDPNRVPFVERQQARAWLGLGDEFLFVSLARHTLQKNGYALVEAFGEVAARHQNAHLLIAGRSDNPVYMMQLGRLRSRLACRERVHLRDHAPWSGALLAAADGFVMNSYFEGWSLATMEALCAGIPVVSSDVAGAREQVGEDRTRGIIVKNPLGEPLAVNWRAIGDTLYSPQVNRYELVTAMSDLIDQRERWAAVREQLRSESLARFDPDHALEGHARILRDCAASVVRAALPVAS